MAFRQRAVAVHSLMEDAATPEISRSPVWQHVRNRTVLADPATPCPGRLANGAAFDQLGHIPT